jgi:hypothetical protein
MSGRDDKLDDVVNELAGNLGDDLYWLTEGGKRNFIDPFTISTLSYLLLTTFLKAAAGAAGAAAGKMLWDAAVREAREVLGGHAKLDRDAIQAECDDARVKVATLSDTARKAAIASAQESMQQALGQVAPHAFAASMAAQTSEAARATVTS